MRYFFIDPAEVRKAAPRVTGADARHMLQVLRLGPGDRIGLLDGTGRGYEAEITACDDSGVAVALEREYAVPRESKLEIVVAQALLKEKKMDRLVRQLTELGIAEWRPVVCERSIARLEGGRLKARVERWRKIAVEAMKQCRRGRVPEIHPPVPLEQLLAMDLDCELKLAFWENATIGLSSAASAAAGCRRAMVLLGPEGGFSQFEMDTAVGHGFVSAGLGPRILRAETATIAAVSLVQYRYGDMGEAVGPLARVSRRSWNSEGG